MSEVRPMTAEEVRMFTMINDLRDEIDRLRTAIDEAPHADGCVFYNNDESGRFDENACNCWKRDALD